MRGTTPLVSAVIATRNRADRLPAAVKSVLAQTVADLELIVVDDASTDDTARVAAELAQADTRVHVLRLESQAGPAGARNHGIRRARAAWLAFLDDDDLWLPWKLEAQLAAAAAPDTVLVYGPMVYVRPDGSEVLFGSERTGGRAAFRRLLRGNVMGLPCTLVNRAALLRVGGFDERLPGLEDWDLWLRLAALGKVRFDAYPVAKAFFTPESVSFTPARIAAASVLLAEKASLLPIPDAAAGADFREAIAHECLMHGSASLGRKLLWQALRRSGHPRRMAKWLAAQLGARWYVLGVRLWETHLSASHFRAGTPAGSRSI